MNLLLIAVGGAAGAAARYLVSGWVQGWTGAAFPLGTLGVNVTGCVALGLTMRLTEGLIAATELRALVAIGFLGAFTTFSTFSLEAVLLMQRGEWARAITYVGASFLLGLVGLWIGLGAPR